MDNEEADTPQFELPEDELLKFAIPELDPGMKLDQNLQHTLEPIFKSLNSFPEPIHDLGYLQMLPFEVQQLALEYVDIATLANFRLVNRKANVMFQELPKYRWLASHFAKVLLAIRRLGTGRWITYSDLYDEVHRSECENCGNFGAWLYVLTGKRVCYTCIILGERYLPLRSHGAQHKYGLEQSMLITQPHMLSIPGTWSMSKFEVKRRKLMFDRFSVHQAALEFHGSVEKMEKAVQQLDAYENQIFAKNNPEAAAKGVLIRKRYDPYDAGCYNPFRYMAVISLPWMNTVEGRFEYGVHCMGCRDYNGSNGQHYQRKFSIQQFRDHIRQLGPIYRLPCAHSARWRHRGQPRPEHWPE